MILADSARGCKIEIVLCKMNLNRPAFKRFEKFFKKFQPPESHFSWRTACKAVS